MGLVELEPVGRHQCQGTQWLSPTIYSRACITPETAKYHCALLPAVPWGTAPGARATAPTLRPQAGRWSGSCTGRRAHPYLDLLPAACVWAGALRIARLTRRERRSAHLRIPSKGLQCILLGSLGRRERSRTMEATWHKQRGIVVGG